MEKLKPFYADGETMEAGCDEAGRGCLAGPVFAAAIILPNDFFHPMLNDSKQLNKKQREKMRVIIEREAISWAVDKVEEQEIDRINILNASIKAMHKAIAGLNVLPELLLIDGNRFYPVPGIAHITIVKGDTRFASIAAASILAKTHRDHFMEDLNKHFPQYGWVQNKGYPTAKHIEAIHMYGITHYHRQSFQWQKPKR